MRAVEGKLGHSLEERHKKSEGPPQGTWHVSACQWVGENVARSGGLIRAILDDNIKEMGYQADGITMEASLTPVQRFMTMLEIRHVGI
jgi:hypothetical protein